VPEPLLTEAHHGVGMRDSRPSLERLTPRRGRGLPPVAVAIAAVAIIAFSIGFAFGGRGAAKPVPPPALAGASVSQQLRTAYLNVIGGGWAVCSIGGAVTCQPEIAIPSIEFPDFATLPLTVTANDWGVLTAANVPPGHYVLAGPMSIFMSPDVTLMNVAPNGVGSLVGLGDHVVLDQVTYVDLGTLSAGRYAGVVAGYELKPGASAGVINATLIGWAVGLVVGP
jgi:hypothetical protein